MRESESAVEYRRRAAILLASPAEEWTSACEMQRPSRFDWPGRWRSFRLNVEATKAAIRRTLAALDGGSLMCEADRYFPGASIASDGENVTVKVRSWGSPLLLLDGGPRV